ncbi:GIY-YIG nuclease family protein [Aquibacillus halophilus]|uniref:GIY-YIG nuclease family protein n=1 Tax=Aquibacillus halophilus TaxID=930132 RepID=UPI0030B84956
MKMVSIQRKLRKSSMEKENRHFVYMLKCKDGTLYTGYTNDIRKRVRMHEQGKGAKYTKGRGPFKLV